MDFVLAPLLDILRIAIDIYILILIVSAVLSWLIAFDVVNPRNRLVYLVGDFCWRATEPALRPIRRFLPNLGGIDISPVIAILLLMLIQRYVTQAAIAMQPGI